MGSSDISEKVKNHRSLSGQRFMLCASHELSRATHQPTSARSDSHYSRRLMNLSEQLSACFVICRRPTPLSPVDCSYEQCLSLEGALSSRWPQKVTRCSSSQAQPVWYVGQSATSEMLIIQKVRHLDILEANYPYFADCHSIQK